MDPDVCGGGSGRDEPGVVGTDEVVDEKEDVVEGGGLGWGGVEMAGLVIGGPRFNGEMVAEGRGESADGTWDGYFPGGGAVGGITGMGDERG